MRGVRPVAIVVGTGFVLALSGCGESPETNRPDGAVGDIPEVPADAHGGDPGLDDSAAPGSGRIGPQGGVLASQDGLLRLEIPAGALAEETWFVVDQVGGSALPDAENLLSLAWKIEPEGLRFQAPVILEITSTREKAQGRLGLVAVLRDGAWQSWGWDGAQALGEARQEGDPVSLDSASGATAPKAPGSVFRAEIGHLSVFSLVESTPGTLGTVAFCDLHSPTDLLVEEGEPAGEFVGRVRIPGLTDGAGRPGPYPGLLVQLGLGTAGTHAETWTEWADATVTGEPAAARLEGAALFRATLPVVPPPGLSDTAFRVSPDGGATWVYCSADRSPAHDGTDAEHPYDPARNGLIYVRPADGSGTPCAPNPCRIPGRKSCSEADGWPRCNCDDEWYEEDGVCVFGQRLRACPNRKPENASWLKEGAFDGQGHIRQAWDGDQWTPAPTPCPWACLPGHTAVVIGWTDECIELRTVSCTNDLPQKARWEASETSLGGGLTLGYHDDGTVTQKKDGGGWTPSAASCPWACLPGSIEAVLAQPTCVELRTTGCPNLLPENAQWMAEMSPVAPGVEVGFVGDGSIRQYSEGGPWLPEPADCPWECKAGYVQLDETSCVQVRTVACANERPENAHWVAETSQGGPGLVIGYLGDGLVSQWQDGSEWKPDAAACPWECDEGHVEWMGACIASRVTECTNELPDHAAWAADLTTEAGLTIGYPGNGTVIQIRNPELAWIPPADQCPFRCLDGFLRIRDGQSGASSCRETRTVSCTNALPTGFHWAWQMFEAEDGQYGYHGNGTVTQVGDDPGGWSPPESACPIVCRWTAFDMPGYGPYCTEVWHEDCRNDLPPGTRWVEQPVFTEAQPCGYTGLGGMKVCKIEGQVVPDPFRPCPFRCDDPSARVEVDNPSGGCLPSRQIACTNSLPSQAHWVETSGYIEGGTDGYPGDGTVVQAQQQDGTWTWDTECPWRCDDGYVPASTPNGKEVCLCQDCPVVCGDGIYETGEDCEADFSKPMEYYSTCDSGADLEICHECRIVKPLAWSPPAPTYEGSTISGTAGDGQAVYYRVIRPDGSNCNTVYVEVSNDGPGSLVYRVYSQDELTGLVNTWGEAVGPGQSFVGSRWSKTACEVRQSPTYIQIFGYNGGTSFRLRYYGVGNSCLP